MIAGSMTMGRSAWMARRAGWKRSAEEVEMATVIDTAEVEEEVRVW